MYTFRFQKTVLISNRNSLLLLTLLRMSLLLAFQVAFSHREILDKPGGSIEKMWKVEARSVDVGVADHEFFESVVVGSQQIADNFNVRFFVAHVDDHASDAF